MSLNGSGVAVINSAGQPVVSSTLITATAFNALTADLATMISTAIMKDGQQTITQNIPFNAKKITGLGAGTARTDAASLATIQDGTGVYVATVGGTADVITLTPSPAITAYVAGQTFRFIASGANTTNVTVAVSGLTAKAITKDGAVALIAGEIKSGAMVEIAYDGTRFIISTVSIPATGSWTPSVGGNATYTSQTGAYTRIGQCLFFTCTIGINVLGTGSANTISGLPIAATTNDFAVSAGEQTALAVSPVSLNPVVQAAGSAISLFGRTAGATGTSLLSILGNGANITITGFYLTS